MFIFFVEDGNAYPIMKKFDCLTVVSRSILDLSPLIRFEVRFRSAFRRGAKPVESCFWLGQRGLDHVRP